MRGSFLQLDQLTGSKKARHSLDNGEPKVSELLNNIYAALVIGPLVIGFWRGTWNLMDELLFPHDELWRMVVLMVFGNGGHLLFMLLQDKLTEWLDVHEHPVAFYCWSRLYTYVYGAMCVATWRGGWILIDHFTTPPDLLFFIEASIVVLLVLGTVNSFCNVAGAPFVNDSPSGYFNVPTYFKAKGSKDPGLYVMDCMFSVLVIGTLVVFVWRGLWVLLDLKLYPEDQGTSAWASVLIGYGVTGVTFSLQPLMRWTCDRLTGFWRVVVADCFLFFSFIGTINVWRGVWQALDTFFLPDQKLLSNWITHGASLLLLILLNCSNSVLVRGVYIDAEEPAGQCVVFPVYYIRLFFQKERNKKQRRLLDTLERADLNSTAGVLQDKKPQSLPVVIPNQQQQQQQQHHHHHHHHHPHHAADQNHQVIRNLEAVPLTIIEDPKSNGDHATSQPPTSN
ncbi:uncharacterized protein LOC126573456 isoform X2 [Anopheles aquasalis]|uniref:uncharacterized protein LOC126573456 isoform X2 n=1 Tax=Anopheles aquasalis TaxID=42839 RepID=UPI00215AD394|nr:uncharacterized protein LOC126573456 isoform X2 [Anopheles aquasalis]